MALFNNESIKFMNENKNNKEANIDNVIKQIRNIIGNHWSSQIHIHIFKDEIYFGIYESEIPVIIDLKKKEVYIECEAIKNYLTSDMLIELGQICKLLQDNLDVFENLLEQ